MLIYASNNLELKKKKLCQHNTDAIVLVNYHVPNKLPWVYIVLEYNIHI